MTQQFYKLTLSEAIAQYQCGLISSTALLYYYLKIRLAPGWKMTLHQREISKQLGISKDQFDQGIHRIKEKCPDFQWEAPNGIVVSFGQNHNSSDKITTPSDKSATPSDKSATPSDKSATTTPSNPSLSQASSDPSNSYQIWLNSLSNTARESFLHFVREKIKDFKSPINDVEGWLAGKNQAGQYRFRVYDEMFQKEVGEAIAPSQDWENHPKWQQALAAMRTGVPRFIVLGQPGCDDLDKQTRQAMADYAEAKNLIWGEDS